MALRYGIEEIPLLVKPTEEEKDEYSMVVRTNFVAVEEEQLEEIKSDLELDEGSIIEDFLFSFEGPDLIDESIMEVTKENSEAVNHEQVTQEVTDFSPTSSLQKYDFLDECVLRSFMFEDEAPHGEKIADLKVTMQEEETFLQ